MAIVAAIFHRRTQSVEEHEQRVWFSLIISFRQSEMMIESSAVEFKGLGEGFSWLVQRWLLTAGTNSK